MDEKKGFGDYEEREAQAVKAIKSQIPESLRSRKADIHSPFVELREHPACPDHYTFSNVDGAGTKPILAIGMNHYSTIGIDAVAMNANDVATLGTFQFHEWIEYLACQAGIEKEKAAEIQQGVVSGLLQCPGITIGKGETASLDEMIRGPKPNFGFDLAGVITGFVKKTEVPSFNPNPGDWIIGLGSSGLHCNGYTAARHILLTGSFEQDPEQKKLYRGPFEVGLEIPGDPSKKPIGEILLEPTIVYAEAIQDIFSKFEGLRGRAFGVNITGYGLKNFNRCGSDCIYEIHHPIKPQPIFKLLQQQSELSDEEMYTKFNMGMGFALVIPHEYGFRNGFRNIIRVMETKGIFAKLVGSVRKGKGKPETHLYLGDPLFPPTYVFSGYQD